MLKGHEVEIAGEKEVYEEPYIPKGSTVEEEDKEIHERHKEDDAKLEPVMSDVFFKKRPKMGNVRKVVTSRPFEVLSVDLMDMNLTSKDNAGYAYALVCVDCFSRFIYAKLIHKKNIPELKRAFQELFSEGMPVPERIWSDEESAMWSNELNDYFESLGIKLIMTGGHSAPAELGIKRIKKILYLHMYTKDSPRWYTILDETVKKCNENILSTTKMSPIEMLKPENHDHVRELMKANYKLTLREKDFKNKLNVGDKVLITRDKGTFEKGFDPNWQQEVFTIRYKRIVDGLPIFYLSGEDGEDIESGWYSHELMRAPQELRSNNKSL